MSNVGNVGPVVPANSGTVTTQSGGVVQTPTGPGAEVDPFNRPSFETTDRFFDVNPDPKDEVTEGQSRRFGNSDYFERNDDGEFVGPWRYSVVEADYNGPTKVVVSNDKTNATFQAGSVDDAETTIRDVYSD